MQTGLPWVLKTRLYFWHRPSHATGRCSTTRLLSLQRHVQKVQLLSSPLAMSTFARISCSMSGMEDRKLGKLGAAPAWPKKRVPACAWQPCEHACVHALCRATRQRQPFLVQPGVNIMETAGDQGMITSVCASQLVLTWACEQLTVGCVLQCSTCLVYHQGVQQQTA